jgi:hypothetical protein
VIVLEKSEGGLQTVLTGVQGEISRLETEAETLGIKGLAMYWILLL